MLRFAPSWSGSANFVLSLNWFSKKGHTCHSEEFVQARSIGLVFFLFGGYLLIKWYVLNKILLSTDNLGLIEICPSRHQLHVRRNGMNTIFCAIGLSCMPEHSATCAVFEGWADLTFHKTSATCCPGTKVLAPSACNFDPCCGRKGAGQKGTHGTMVPREPARADEAVTHAPPSIAGVQSSAPRQPSSRHRLKRRPSVEAVTERPSGA